MSAKRDELDHSTVSDNTATSTVKLGSVARSFDGEKAAEQVIAGPRQADNQSTQQQIHRKFDHIHKLERKNSSGDLHSRLKTRKLLGVGETDDGDVHRSKLSQILGHNDQLYLRLPRGTKAWRLFTSILFTVLAAWAIILPRSLLSYTLYAELGDISPSAPIRLYGSALSALAVFCWGTLQTTDKDLVRLSLFASLVFFSLHFLVSAISLLQLGLLLQSGLYVLPLGLLGAGISFYFYRMTGDHQPFKLKKSNSSKDIQGDINAHSVKSTMKKSN